MNADVVISMCAPTNACYATAQVALRTCAAHTDANIIVVANNMPVAQYKDALFASAKAFGMKWYSYDKTPLNIGALFNEVWKSTSSKYYTMCQQDVIFYDKWLDNLIEAWEREPSYFLLAPWSFNLHRKDFSCDLLKHPRNGIVPAWPHDMAVLAFRRDKPWYFDENLPAACDSDLYHHCRNNGLATGIVANSRVDHLEHSIVMYEVGAVMGNPNQRQEDAVKLKKKWNL